MLTRRDTLTAAALALGGLLARRTRTQAAPPVPPALPVSRPHTITGVQWLSHDVGETGTRQTFDLFPDGSWLVRIHRLRDGHETQLAGDATTPATKLLAALLQPAAA